MKRYPNLILIAAILATTACGSTTSSSGADSTADATTGDDTASADTTSTSDTTSTTDTAGTTGDTMSGDLMNGNDMMSGDVSPTGDMMSGGDGGNDGGGDTCMPCLKSKCGTQLNACVADAVCSAKMPTIGDCLKAAGTDATAKQKCLDDFAALGATESGMLTCVQSSCKAECM